MPVVVGVKVAVVDEAVEPVTVKPAAGTNPCEDVVGVKLPFAGARLKLTSQPKIYPLSEDKLSVTSMVQLPFNGQPIKLVNGWVGI